jgi:hypothetical protein
MRNVLILLCVAAVAVCAFFLTRKPATAGDALEVMHHEDLLDHMGPPVATVAVTAVGGRPGAVRG